MKQLPCRAMLLASLMMLPSPLMGVAPHDQGFELSTQSPAPGQMTVWRHQKWNLTLPPETALTLSQDDKAGIYAVVRYTLNSALEKSLMKSPKTLLMQALGEGSNAIAVVRADSLQELDPAAQMAHVAEGFRCGSVELLDLSTAFADGPVTPLAPVHIPTTVIPKVEQVIKTVKGDNIRATVQQLENLGTRHHNTARGQGAPNTIKQMFDSVGSGITGIQSSLFTHQLTNQKSVIITIPGTEENDNTVIIGGHLDSINYANIENSPGADDDASGIATMLEVVRVIKESGIRFKRRIEFHGYAAEEVGLVGSAEIARSYRTAGRTIAAMMQLDMTAYTADTKTTIYLANNDTTAEIRQGVKNILDAYLGGDYVEATLAAGTSDHRSWFRQGFASVFPFEHPDNYNPTIHTDRDKTGILNFPLAERYAKLTLAFLGHYAGLAEASSPTGEPAPNPSDTSLSEDLKVAIVATTGGTDRIMMVATPTAITRVDICIVTHSQDENCQGERLPLTLNGTRDNRHVFWEIKAQPQPAAGQTWRLIGYDNADKSVALRHLSLE